MHSHAIASAIASNVTLSNVGDYVLFICLTVPLHDRERLIFVYQSVCYCRKSRLIAKIIGYLPRVQNPQRTANGARKNIGDPLRQRRNGHYNTCSNVTLIVTR